MLKLKNDNVVIDENTMTLKLTNRLFSHFRRQFFIAFDVVVLSSFRRHFFVASDDIVFSPFFVPFDIVFSLVAFDVVVFSAPPTSFFFLSFSMSIIR